MLLFAKKLKKFIKNIYAVLIWTACKRKPNHVCIEPQWGRNRLMNISPIPEEIKSEMNEADLGEKVCYDLSIIVPIYNVEKYLKECLESIKNQQTEYSFEVILVNDGSTDSSRSICEEGFVFLPGWKLINTNNYGLSAARNKGLHLCSGRYVMFVDSDDYLPDGAVEAFIKAAVGSNADIVQAGFTRLIGRSLIPAVIDYESDCILDSFKQICRLPGYAWGKIFKKELFENTEFPIGYWFEDTLIPYRIFPKCKCCACIRQEGYVYRDNAGGINWKSKQNVRALETYWLVEKLLKDKRESGEVITGQLYLFTMWQLCVMTYERISWMEEDIIKIVFSLSCQLVREMQEDLRLRGEAVEVQDRKLQFLERAYITSDFAVWKGYAIYMRMRS